MTTLLEGTEDAHQHRLGLRPYLAPVSVAVLPHDDRGAEDPLRVVVVGRDLGMFRERDQLALVPPKPLPQPPRVPLLPRPRQQLVEPIPQPPPPRREPLRGQLSSPLAQPD